MATEPNGNGKKKGGRPKAPPAPPALGIAERTGPGYKLVIVLAGLKVNGKKYDPQTGAENLADMFVYCMRTPEADPADKMVAEAAADDLPSLESLEKQIEGAIAKAEGRENGSH